VEQRSGAQISIRAFIQSLIILFILMMGAGILTLVVPPGTYEMMEQEGRLVIDRDRNLSSYCRCD
jgi:uncharacterized ion transporter superfamily protein YfcC